MDDALAELVRIRAANCCEYCRMPQAYDRLKFQIDHIIAEQHRGPTISENLAFACYTCNHHKGPNIAGYDLITKTTVPLFNPRIDIWADHFQWREAELEGLTPIGRVTIHVLAINRDFRIGLRDSLLIEGVFPPD